MNAVEVMQPVAGEKMGIGNVMQRAFSIMSSSVTQIALILLCFVFPAQLLFLAVPVLIPQAVVDLQGVDPSTFNWALIIPALIAGMVLFLAIDITLTLFGYIMMILLADKKRQGLNPSFGELFEEAKGLWPKSISVYLLMSLGIFAGFLLLFIPGIYIAVIWMFALPLIVLNPGVKSAFTASKKLVDGRWWKTFGYALLLFIVCQLIMAVLSFPQHLLLQYFSAKDVSVLYALPDVMNMWVALVLMAVSATLVNIGLVWDWIATVVMFRAFEANPEKKLVE